MSDITNDLIHFGAFFTVVFIGWAAHRRGEKAAEAEKKLHEPPQHEIDELVDACGRFTL